MNLKEFVWKVAHVIISVMELDIQHCLALKSMMPFTTELDILYVWYMSFHTITQKSRLILMILYL